MKLVREDLIECLEKVYPAVSTSTLVPEFACFRFVGDKLQGTDGSLCITTALPVDTGIYCTVPGQTFLQLLRSLEETEIELRLKETSLSVHTKRLKGKFSVKADCILLPSKEYIDYIEDKLLIDSVVEGLSFCRYGVSSDETSETLCGVMLNDDKVTSSDGYKIVKSTLLSPTGFRCSLPVKFCNILIKNAKTLCMIGLSEENTFTAMLEDGTRISSYLLQGELKDLDVYFPDDSEVYQELSFVKSFEACIDRHVEFLKEVDMVDKVMSIILSGTECTFLSKNTDLKKLEETVELVSPVEAEIRIEVNPTFFRGIIKDLVLFRYFKEIKTILLGSTNQRILFKELEV